MSNKGLKMNVTKLGVVLQSLIFFILCYFTLTAADKGLDFTDEGFYLLYSSGNYNDLTFFTYAHLIIAKIVGLFNLKIVGVRILRFILQILAVMFLAHSTSIYLKKKKLNFSTPNLYLILLNSVFLGYALGPQSFSYNSLLAVLIFAAVGSYLLSLASATIKIQYAALLFCGIMLDLIVLSKVTAGALFILLFGLLIAFNPEKRVKRVLVFLSGLLAGMFIISLLICNYFDAISNIYLAGRYISVDGGSHSFDKLKEELLVFRDDFFKELFLAAITFLLYKFIDLLKSNGKVDLKKILQLVLFCGAAGLVLKKYLAHPFDGTITKIIIYALLVSLLLFLDKNRFKICFKSREFYHAVILFLFPLVCVAGTNNALVLNTMIYITFWVLLVYLMLNQLEKPLLNAGVMLIISALILHNTYNKMWKLPYRILPMTEQTEFLSFPDQQNLQVDRQTSDFLNSLDTVLKKNGFKKGDPLVAVFKMPALNYLFEAHAPGGLLWNETEKSLFFYNLKKDITKNGSIRPVFVINQMFSQEFSDSLNKYFSFPAEYQVAGQLEYKQSGCWVLFPK